MWLETVKKEESSGSFNVARCLGGGGLAKEKHLIGVDPRWVKIVDFMELLQLF